MPTTAPPADNAATAEPTRRVGRMEAALGSARDAASDALQETKEVARRAGEAIEANPMAVVAGGVALGLVAGALLPKTKRETELLGPVGRRLTDAASDAATAAKDAAKIEFATIPLSKEAAREQVSKVLDQVAKAISTAGEAALASKPTATVNSDPTPPRRARKAD